MTRWIEAEEVPGLLQPGMTVFVAGATAEPGEMLKALGEDTRRCAGIRFVSVSIPGVNDFDFTDLHPRTKATAFLATAGNRQSIADGRVDYLPMHYSSVYRYLERELAIDALLVQLPPVGADGVLSLGLSADFVPAVLEKATLVIAEINERQPRPADAPTVPPARLDYALSCNRPVPAPDPSGISENALVIGRHVAELIDDGDCIQIGIGGLPDAILSCLESKNDLGVHSGLISDGIMALAKAGNINGRRKSRDTGKIVSGVTLGSEELVQWAGEARQLAIRPVSYTHDCAVIGSIGHFVSINSALEVDLWGQVNAEMLRGRQISGTGGAVDMMRAAAISRGGKSIVALESTAGNGKYSRIVSTLTPGNVTTALRTDVDYVVTEFGARQIRHLDLRARAAALIEIAHPDFRDQLRDGLPRC